jgi:hypothetical protein
VKRPPYRKQVRDLLDLLGSHRQVAELLGVSHSVIAGWLDGQIPRTNRVRRISDASTIVDALASRRGAHPTAVAAALFSSWRELGGVSPATLIAADRGHEVLEVLRQSEREPSEYAPPTAAQTDDLQVALNALAIAARDTVDALRNAQVSK